MIGEYFTYDNGRYYCCVFRKDLEYLYGVSVCLDGSADFDNWYWMFKGNLNDMWKICDVSDIPLNVSEIFSDPLLEIGLERFIHSGKSYEEIS